MDRTLSAPGKLFISGEYAVLWGGLARVAAVAPRITAMVKRRSDRQVEILLEGTKLIGAATPLGVQWDGPVQPEFRFVAHTLDWVLRAVGKEVPGFSFAIESSPQGPDGMKLGLGSSARAVILAAEAARYALNARFDAFKLALVAHAEIQGGRGSGADVAACFAGSWIRYRQFPVASLIEAGKTEAFAARLAGAPPVDLFKLAPMKFPLAYAFTGKSASTPTMIAEIEHVADANFRAKFAAASDGLGRHLEEGLLGGDLALVRETCESLQKLLGTLSTHVTEPSDQWVRMGRTFNCPGKISGAGGGDGCIFFCADLDAREALIEALTTRGVYAIPVEVEDGLRGEPLRHRELTHWFT